MDDSSNPDATPGHAITVAAAVWPWRESSRGARPGDAGATLRRQGLVRALAGVAIAGILLLVGLRTLAAVGGAISLLVGLAALASPGGLYRGIGRALDAFGRLVGRLIAVLTLSPVFFLFFAVFGRLLRTGRRDRLARFFDRGTPTYWLRRTDAEPTPERYERSF